MSFDVTLDEPWLVARFAECQRMLSWSIVRPGFVEADCVAWLQVRDSDLTLDIDPVGYFRNCLQEKGLKNAVGLLTSSHIRKFQHVMRLVDGVEASALVTFGLSNATHVGLPSSSMTNKRFGTINVLCHVSEHLSEAAHLEAISIATQARTAAVMEADYCLSAGHDRPVSGTGTDCIVLACPSHPGGGGEGVSYAGLHTAIGMAVGSAVYHATQEIAANWLAYHSSGGSRLA